ncbi:MAG: hypothetical protein J6C33_08220 [Lachnospiraceae bacterium]|nr:hypothetical protein [Lachnospiraceae bacterium]
MSFSDMILGENGFLIELRCDNAFNEQTFSFITDYLRGHAAKWRANDSVPAADAAALFHLIDELSGGSRFWSEEVRLRAEDAVLELFDLIDLLET